MLYCGFDPIYDERSVILILGSFPSVKSREQGFYYGHPRNRFWKVVASLCKENVPETIEQKRAMLLEHKIAVWDVVSRCSVKGSSDSSIRETEINDVANLLFSINIKRVFANGATAGSLYRKYIEPKAAVGITVLPSTSPANAAWSEERLIKEWSVLISI